MPSPATSLRPNKWLDGVDPDAPVHHAAVAAVARRWSAVAGYLPLAALHGNDDVEYVHQLRVSTRRADAALEQFATLLPPKAQARAARRLKRLRNAAGPARDTDVFLARLEATDLEACAIDRKDLQATILKRLKRRRKKAQRTLVAAYREAWPRFAGRGHRLTAKVSWRLSEPEPLMCDFAVERMRSVLSHWSRCGQTLDDDLALHAFRIAGKRVRYAMELFAAAFPSTFRDELYAEFKNLQDHLGAANDHVTAIADCRAWRRKSRSSRERSVLKRLIKHEKKLLATSRQEFFDWWTPERAASLGSHFEGLIASPATTCPSAIDSAQSVPTNDYAPGRNHDPAVESAATFEKADDGGGVETSSE